MSVFSSYYQPFGRWLFLLLLLGQAPELAAQELDKPPLLQGVGPVPLPVKPEVLSTTLTLTKQPEIILTAPVETPLPDQSFQTIAVVTSRLGKGKLVVFSAAAYFRPPLVQDTAVQHLLRNCLKWGSGTRPTRVQVWGGDGALRRFLTRQAGVQLVGTATALDATANVLLLNQAVADTRLLRSLEHFVRRGGTLFCGFPLPSTPNAPGQLNPLLVKAGLWQSTYSTLQYPTVHFLSASPAPAHLGMRNILHSLRTHHYPTVGPWQGGDLFAYTLEMAVAQLAPTSPVVQQLRNTVYYHPDSLLVPTPERPLEQGNGPRYLAYHVQHRLLDQELRAHPNPTYQAPAAATFPGAVPTQAPRLTTELALPVKVGPQGLLEPAPVYRQPHSTGLYVPAGEIVRISLSATDASRHLQAQIGVHEDDASQLPTLTREAFDLTHRFELRHGYTEIYSPYGGLLLLNVPDTSTLHVVRLRVQGAVQAPRFERGKTSLAEWQQTIRHYPAPWAELASENISLTVPAARIRALDDPEQLLAFWDAVLATEAQLAALPLPRRHPERVIVDQVVASGAYMFTDAKKIVVPNDTYGCAQMLDVHYLQQKGSWGHFHELGHRHQFHGIDFSGLREVSVNLYTLYVFDKLLHKGLYQEFGPQSRQQVADDVTRYLDESPSFEKWQSDPSLALCMYIQLISSFGWEPIEQVYRQYRQLPRSQYPTTEAAKRDYWFSAICAATHRNLGPFFALWRVPVSPEAEKAAAGYPGWLPPEMQPK
ncbi:M60 family metallopeptidase [Hymenobacter profundi]|uniref:M60 family metallopeptidase n=1 Tax=Hymenobacter profundi TaxID=1982110 RepID=A0ABS6X0X1_9BACT|nr:M60 family metallopeptidase [Hymenobacter profundi]MBW3129428.1 M60 family metallopeptidase [Hymenobacter profundi]